MTRKAQEGNDVSGIEGKHCVLTGGAGSIGLASARQLLARGATVFLVDRDPALLDAARSGLPVGLAVDARPGDDGHLLQVGMSLEACFTAGPAQR